MVIGAEYGSMEMSTLPVFINHINKFIQLYVDKSKPLIPLLDGRSSRNGQVWLAPCEKCRVISIRLQAIPRVLSNHVIHILIVDLNEKFERCEMHC